MIIHPLPFVFYTNTMLTFSVCPSQVYDPCYSAYFHGDLVEIGFHKESKEWDIVISLSPQYPNQSTPIGLQYEGLSIQELQVEAKKFLLEVYQQELARAERNPEYPEYAKARYTKLISLLTKE